MGFIVIEDKPNTDIKRKDVTLLTDFYFQLCPADSHTNKRPNPCSNSDSTITLQGDGRLLQQQFSHYCIILLDQLTVNFPFRNIYAYTMAL